MSTRINVHTLETYFSTYVFMKMRSDKQKPY